MKRGRRILAAALTLSLLMGQTAYAQEYMPKNETVNKQSEEKTEEVEQESALETIEVDTSSPETEETLTDLESDIQVQETTVESNTEINDTSDAEGTSKLSTGDDEAEAQELVLGENTVPVNAGETTIMAFTPEEDGRYIFYSTGSSDTYGYLYDSEMNELDSDYSSGEDFNFQISYELEAGLTYYVGVKYRSSSESGDVTVIIEKTVKPADEELVPFKDSALEEALVNECDFNGDGYITYDELREVTYLNLSSKGITDISGLEYATNLKKIVLRNNNIVDITPIAGLSKLTYLYLSNTKITDISILSNFTDLEQLYLAAVPFTDISSLAGLKNLISLNLSDTSVDDISALANLNNLVSLDLSNTSVNEVEALSGLTNLKYLYLNDNDISDFSPLSGLSNLYMLYIEKSTRDNLKDLSELKSLVVLNMADSVVQSLEGAENLENLRYIYLNNTSGIESLKPLAGLHNLEYINLEDSDITTETKWEFLIGEKNRTIGRGDVITFGLEGLMKGLSYTVEIPEDTECIHIQQDSKKRTIVSGLKVGQVTIHFTCDELVDDVVVNIVDESSADEIGETVVDNASAISVDEGKTAAILDENANLWETYPEIKKIGENVKQYVARSVYGVRSDSGNAEEVNCFENKYILDNDGVLWLDGEKLAENVEVIDHSYALDSQGNLMNIVNSSHPVVGDVVKWIIRDSSSSYAYALKKDGTVWKLYTSMDENEVLKAAELFAEDVVDIVQWGEYYVGYLKSDGSIMNIEGECLYNPINSGNIKAVSLYNPDSEFSDSNLLGFYGEDNNFYLTMCHESSMLVNLGSIKVSDVAYKNNNIFYILTDKGDIIKLNSSSSSNYASETVVSGAARLNHNVTGECDYQGIDGLYYHIADEGSQVVESSISTVVGHYELMEKYGGKQNVLVMYGETFLDQIVTTWKDTESGSIKYYALRVDGTIWDITGAPKKIGTIAEDEEEVENPFVDVSESSYYYDAVLWAYDQGITTGKDATHFLPDNTCTRAQVATFLWRAKGEPEPSTTENPFVDVKAADYYYKAVLWAYENGITTGKDATHFLPDSTVTRNQFVTFLWRAEGQPAATISNPFVDVPNGQYYTTAVLWAYENGITTGKDATHFLPANGCTRAQVAAFLYRAYQ